MIVKFDDRDAKFIESHYWRLNDVIKDGDEWFFDTAIYNKIGDSLFEVNSFDKLPNKVQDLIKNIIRKECNV